MAEEKIDLSQLSDEERTELYAKQVQDMKDRAPQEEDK